MTTDTQDETGVANRNADEFQQEKQRARKKISKAIELLDEATTAMPFADTAGMDEAGRAMNKAREARRKLEDEMGVHPSRRRV